tara:strand:+ start:8677 stop:10887 length:2211 start_codon:yes stop_codon:yes gene_type:complete
MKKLNLLLIFFAFIHNVFAGDTTTIRIHNQTDMTWYGNYDEWGVLPDASNKYRKIYLHYTMGCATGGCSDWDYTTQIFVKHRTGEIDSSLQITPQFTVNGNTLDTIMYSNTITYISSWDSTTNSVDSVLSNLLEIIIFNDSSNPTIATDTIYAYEAGFYNMIYDSIGNIIGQAYCTPDSTLINSNYNWYQSFDVIENYELARVITPYGNGLSNNWSFTTTFDITDFEKILRDSVEIRCHYSGWSSGFSATLDFEFIEGIPARDVLTVENIYTGGHSYVTSTDFEANKLNTKKLHINSNTENAMIKMTTTGHGFDNNQVAAEFKPINYYLNINGIQTHTQYNWDTDCGENPIFPQGGTWLYDRANWCPGKRAQAFDHEITPYIIPGDSIEIDIDFQEYSWSGTQTPSYIIECQLFEYTNPNFTNSAEIIDIIKPSKKDEHSRKNPICGKPLIIIRNYGENALTSLDIEYNVKGGALHTFNWTGNLGFLETEEVELPNLSSWAGSNNIFEVSLKNPNGQTDEYNENNFMSSEFDLVPEYPETFALWVSTNSGVINTLSQESETSWDFYDINGNNIFTSGSLYSNTQYRDTLTFSPGCYTFVMQDTDEDGLDFWANNDGGGIVRFREIGASWLKAFNADFGTNIIHEFMIGGSQNIAESNRKWEIFPIPTQDYIEISGFANNFTEINIVDSFGKTITTFQHNSVGEFHKKIDIKDYANGIYFIQIKDGLSHITKKFVKK